MNLILILPDKKKTTKSIKLLKKLFNLDWLCGGAKSNIPYRNLLNVFKNIKEHDILIIAGRGDCYGCFGVINGTYTIFPGLVQFLRKFQLVLLWDNSYYFAKKYQLHGLFVDGRLITDDILDNNICIFDDDLDIVDGIRQTLFIEYYYLFENLSHNKIKEIPKKLKERCKTELNTIKITNFEILKIL